jgi:hypothetical protein
MAFTYKVIEAKSHDNLTDRINEAARTVWEAVNAYSVSGSNVGAAHHFALLRK